MAGQAALALKKTFALAEIAINLSRELSAIGTAAAANPLNIPTAGVAGITQNAILTAIAIAKAAVLTAKVLVFRSGGIAEGPSHEQGGIPLYYRRRPAGIEIEGGEPILIRNVSRNPALLAAPPRLSTWPPVGAHLPVPSGHFRFWPPVASPAPTWCASHYGAAKPCPRPLKLGPLQPRRYAKAHPSRASAT